MKKIIKISFLLLSLAINQLIAQGHQDVFPLLYGMEAQTAVANGFTPQNILNYNNARDTLFKRVLAENDSLTCVYSGHTVYMDPTEDPTTTVFQNGGTNGINTEHTWPQAYGAGDGDPRSNMYHLFPTRIKVNEARANFPFAEISDAQTQAWYYLNQVQSNIPANNIEKYSEYRQSSFEPREDFKGDIARAMVYFYTIYNDAAQDAPNGFFENQLPTLYQWHLHDPVDAKEWDRNTKIAPYQSNKSNPYILDSTLVGRVFCQELGIPCAPNSINEAEKKSIGFTVTPNPHRGQATINYHLPQGGHVHLILFNSLGQKIAELVNGNQQAGSYSLETNIEQISNFENGLYYYRLKYELEESTFLYIHKTILLR